LNAFGARAEIPRPLEGPAIGGDVAEPEAKDAEDSKRPARSSVGLLPDPEPLLEPRCVGASSKSMSESDSFLPGRNSAGIEAGGVSPRLNASYRARTLLIWSFVWRYVSKNESIRDVHDVGPTPIPSDSGSSVSALEIHFWIFGLEFNKIVATCWEIRSATISEVRRAIIRHRHLL
jgi:hypothetical protein